MARGRHDYEKKVIAVESEGYQDLHGRGLMNDNLEDAPFKWIGSGTGIHTESRQARAAYNGGYGMELDITSTLPPNVQRSGVLRYIPIDVTERLEFKAFWRADVVARLFQLEYIIEYYNGAQYLSTAIRYNRTNTAWTYFDQVGGWTAIPNSVQTFYDNAWNELTLSVDFSVSEYIRMKCNNMDLNMGGIPCRNMNNLTGAHAEVWIHVYNDTGNQLLVSFDDLVVKELEN